MIYAGESKLEKTHSTDIWGRKSLSQTAGQLPYSSTPHHNFDWTNNPKHFPTEMLNHTPVNNKQESKTKVSKGANSCEGASIRVLNYEKFLA